ncbi:MAG: ABC transporter permease [Pseudomonadota bacterium]
MPAKRQPEQSTQALIEEFRDNPIGHHSPELQRLLNKVRATPTTDKYCLVVVKPNREWQLAKTTGVPGKPVKLLKQIFTSLESAEWYVFKKRWKAMTGESLKD